MNKQIIVALDGMSEKKALDLAVSLKGLVWGFKINDLLFNGAAIIGKLKKYGKVFADAKLYDIPNTVKNSVTALPTAGADLITVHASGGIEMMKAAKKSAGKSKIIAVTILTSVNGQQEFLNNSISKLAKNATNAGVNGIVCSARELKTIAKIGELRSLIKIVPGIRPIWYDKNDDQKRIVTPREAILAGADFIIIGRPITESLNPAKTVRIILADLNK